MNYRYTLWLESTNIPKTLRPFQKHRCQKSDKLEVRNQKFKHCLGVLAHTICKYIGYVSPNPEMGVTFISGDNWNAESTCILEAVHIDIQTAIIERLKHEFLLVSKSVARHQKHVHITACPARRYVQEPGGRSRWCLYLYLRSLTILRLKRCNNWWPGISRMKQWRTTPTSISICPQTRQVHRNHKAPCDYTLQEAVKNRKLHLSFPRYWGSFW
jgi:hypothetical protein